MITEKDLKEAINVCHSVHNPTASTCAKLASYYTILDHVGGQENNETYSLAPPPDDRSTVQYNVGTEFSDAIYGRPIEEVWSDLDEVMAVIKAIHPKLYRSIINKLKT